MQRKDGFVPSSSPGPGFTPKFLVIFMIIYDYSHRRRRYKKKIDCEVLDNSHEKVHGVYFSEVPNFQCVNCIYTVERSQHKLFSF